MHYHSVVMTVVLGGEHAYSSLLVGSTCQSYDQTVIIFDPRLQTEQVGPSKYVSTDDVNSLIDESIVPHIKFCY